MDRILLSVLLFAIGLASAGQCAAQELFRCRAASGERIYTDKPCEKFSAVAEEPPTAPTLPPDNTIEVGSQPSPAATEAEPIEEPPSAAQGCLGSDADALRRAVLDTALHADLNGLAGLWDWPSGAPANAVFARLRRLIDATPVQASVEPGAVGTAHLVLYSDADATIEVGRFRLVQRAGCLWLANR